MKRCLLILVACLSGLATSAAAQFEAARAEFLPGWRMADGTHVAAVLIDLQPGWKTYWRNPGDAGIPPRFDWAGSRNVGTLDIQWPTPKPMDQNGMTSVGYPSDVVVPLIIRPGASGQAVRLNARMELGVCKDICVPAELTFSGTLPADGKRDPRIVAALANRPLSEREAGVKQVACRIAPVRGGLTLTAEIDMPSAGGTEFVVVETANPSVWVAEAMTRRTGERLTATTELSHVDGAPFALDRSGLRFTVLGRDRAVDIKGCKGR